MYRGQTLGRFDYMVPHLAITSWLNVTRMAIDTAKVKTMRHILLILILVGLLLVQNASAFYDPCAQRWLNRDPIAEAGGINLFEFVQNGPTIKNDALGYVSLLNSEEAKRRAELALQKYIDDPADEINWFNYLIAQAIANEACLPPPSPPAPEACPAPYRFPPLGPPPPQIQKCGLVLVGGTVMYWICSEGSRLFLPRNLLPIP